MSLSLNIHVLNVNINGNYMSEKKWRKVPSMAKINALKKKFSLISFFSGCGGSSTGYKMAGYDCKFANEFIPEAATTYRANHEHTIVDSSDIRKVKPKDILKQIGLKVGELDLLDGSPPCHPEGTLIFTKRGYVEIQNIVEGDYVLTHKNRWRKVTGTTKRKYKGPMLKLITMNAEPVHCTPSHPFYVLENKKKLWKEAVTLTTDSYIKVPRDSQGTAMLPMYSGVDIGVGYNRITCEFTRTVNVNTISNFFENEDFWWIVGRFLGDGWVSERRKMSAKHAERRPSGLSCKGVTICCNKNNNERYDITTVLDRLGWKYKVKNRRTVARIGLKGIGAYGSRAELVDFFKQFGRECHGKRLPQFVYDMPHHLKKALVIGYVSADGRERISKYGSKSFGYCSVSRELLYGITRLVNDSYDICTNRIKSRAPGVWNIEGRSGVTMRSYGTGFMYDAIGSPICHTKDRNGDLWVRLRKAESYDFEGYVYNMHVEEDESFTANNLASHNCSAFSNAGSRDKGWGKEKKYSDSKQRVDDLFDEYIRMVKYIQPRVFVAENVPGLVSGKAKGYYVHIIKSLTACGYKVSGSILDASYLDVPQARRRLIIVGVRNDLVKMGFNPVFPQKNSYQVYASDVLPYITGIREARSMSYIHAQRPFFTITASDATTTETAQFSSGGFIETKKGTQRKLTLKELRVASSFPKDFILTGTFEQQWERIGRAVPPMMMFHVAKAIRDKILIPYHEKFDEKL